VLGFCPSGQYRIHRENKRSLTPTRALYPFTPKAGVNGDPKARASLTEFWDDERKKNYIKPETLEV